MNFRYVLQQISQGGRAPWQSETVLQEQISSSGHERRAEMSDVSEESLLDYFHSAGGDSGRVRNADILKTFKPLIGHSDVQLRGK